MISSFDIDIQTDGFNFGNKLHNLRINLQLQI
jgi:hypothetical protein